MENEIFNDMYKVETQHWWFVARRKIIEHVIKKLNLIENASIFDAGCGTGDNLNMLSKFGNVVAMERDNNAFGKAKSRGVGEVFKGELPDGVHEKIKKENFSSSRLLVLNNPSLDEMQNNKLRDLFISKYFSGNKNIFFLDGK